MKVSPQAAGFSDAATAGSSTTADLPRPPTMFGRQSPRWLAHAGHDLARRAVGYQMEKVPFDDAVTQLLESHRDERVFQMARDYLAFTHFDDTPLATQVDALALIDSAVYRNDRRARRRPARLKAFRTDHTRGNREPALPAPGHIALPTPQRPSGETLLDTSSVGQRPETEPDWALGTLKTYGGP